MADEDLTLVLMKKGKPIGKPIKVGKFEPSPIYSDKVALANGYFAPYKVEVRITRLQNKEEKSGAKAKRKAKVAA